MRQILYKKYLRQKLETNLNEMPKPVKKGGGGGGGGGIQHVVC